MRFSKKAANKKHFRNLYKLILQLVLTDYIIVNYTNKTVRTGRKHELIICNSYSSFSVLANENRCNLTSTNVTVNGSVNFARISSDSTAVINAHV